ncbi:hypothetical protein FRC02_008588 [Tulasnella sp. 418]|nr:hypothetical protein FRC02_008588 [Tulasnella sp. 418]
MMPQAAIHPPAPFSPIIHMQHSLFLPIPSPAVSQLYHRLYPIDNLPSTDTTNFGHSQQLSTQRALSENSDACRYFHGYTESRIYKKCMCKAHRQHRGSCYVVTVLKGPKRLHTPMNQTAFSTSARNTSSI